MVFRARLWFDRGMRFVALAIVLLVWVCSGTARRVSAQGGSAPAGAASVGGLFGPAPASTPVHPELERLLGRLAELVGRPGVAHVQRELSVARAALARARTHAGRPGQEAAFTRALGLASAALASAEAQLSARRAELAVAAAERALALQRASVAELERELAAAEQVPPPAGPPAAGAPAPLSTATSSEPSPEAADGARP